MTSNAKKVSEQTIILGLLALNALLLIYVAFIKKDAVRLETMKVGGSANMVSVQQLYNSDAYKAQQTQAIQQVLGSMAQQGQPTVDMAAEGQPTVDAEAQQPAVK